MTTDEGSSRILLTTALPAQQVGELAGVTYRQVDHWTRQGYVTPSVRPAVKKGARRMFSPADVVLVAALGRFGRARLDISLVGPLVAALEPITTADGLLVAHLDPLSIELVDQDCLRDRLASSGPCVVFDPGPVLARLTPLGAAVVATEPEHQPAQLREVS